MAMPNSERNNAAIDHLIDGCRMPYFNGMLIFDGFGKDYLDHEAHEDHEDHEEIIDFNNFSFMFFMSFMVLIKISYYCTFHETVNTHHS